MFLEGTMDSIIIIIIIIITIYIFPNEFQLMFLFSDCSVCVDMSSTPKNLHGMSLRRTVTLNGLLCPTDNGRHSLLGHTEEKIN